MLLQASWQAGPSSLAQTSRDSHIELEEECFGHDLLSTLEVGLTSVESNWQGSLAALSFISLAARLMSVSLHESVRERCLEFLSRARRITVKWLRMVAQLLHVSTDETESAYLTLRALDLGLICHSTFDIDPRQLRPVLSSTDNVAILIEAMSVVNDHWPVSLTSFPMLTRELLRRFSRTSHMLESALKKQIITSPDGINLAVGRVWVDYEPVVTWAGLEAPDDRWLVAYTAESEESSSTSVHFNTLTGSLLINCRPLGRLPRQYEEHANYKRLFGNKILQVIPSNKGLFYATRNLIDGYKVRS